MCSEPELSLQPDLLAWAVGLWANLWPGRGCRHLSQRDDREDQKVSSEVTGKVPVAGIAALG